MKKLFLFLALFVAAQLSAVNYCAPQSWGYCGTSVTGGGSATPTLVSSESALKTALGKGNNVIIITQDITVTNHISSSKSNMTIMALPGKRLISTQQNADYSGILYLKGSNLILRNITFEGPGAYDCDGWDLLCLDGAKNVWVDHCDFQDGCDDNFDIKGKADNITVSWCRFRYLKSPKSGGSGGSDDHRFSNLIGSGSTDKPSDGKYSVTWAYCWWDEGCVERMTRCRNSELHFLNCYWNSSDASYYVGPENASCYFEGCTFAGAANKANKIWKPYDAKIDGQTVASVNYCKFTNCAGNVPSNSGSVSAPSYTYDQLSASDAKTYVTNTSCGAGATLTVTNAGAVSSSCDSGTTPDPDPIDPDPDPQTDIEPITTSTFWNISDDDFKALGVISSNTIVRNLLIAAKPDTAVTIDGSAKSVDGYDFTHRLKFGGSGSANCRHLRFKVTGACSLTVYLTRSSGSGDPRTLKISSGSFSNVISTMSAPVGSVAKATYSYTGSATTIYLYSAASGINIYGIKVDYSGEATGFEDIENQSAAHKVLRNGQVVILREGKTYSILGARVD